MTSLTTAMRAMAARTLHRWKPVLPLLAISSAMVGGAAQAAADDAEAAARAAITKTAEAFVAAFAKEDAKALAEFWTPDGDLVDLSGRTIAGRDAIAADFAELFAQNEGLSVRIEVHSVRFPTPDTAIEDGVTTVLHTDGGLPNRARYTNLLVRRDGRWLLSSVRESAFVPPSHYEQLRPLEWMIGEWAEEAPKDSSGAAANAPLGRVAFGWTPDRNFIVVERAVTTGDTILANGTERIGWDPAAKIIRSWTFETDGGFGEGAWTRDGDRWVSRMSSVLGSGSLMTSTATVKRIDANTISWQATDRVLDGKPMPDSPVITMRRVF